MLWVFACWMVTLYTERPLQPDQLQDDLADVDTSDIHRKRVMWEADRQQWLNVKSDVVSKAVRMRHIRQAVRR